MIHDPEMTVWDTFQAEDFRKMADELEVIKQSIVNTVSYTHLGVETDEDGEVIAYHFSKHHPLSYANEPMEWVRVPAYGATTGRRNCLLYTSRCV